MRLSGEDIETLKHLYENGHPDYSDFLTYVDGIICKYINHEFDGCNIMFTIYENISNDNHFLTTFITHLSTYFSNKTVALSILWMVDFEHMHTKSFVDKFLEYGCLRKYFTLIYENLQKQHKKIFIEDFLTNSPDKYVHIDDLIFLLQIVYEHNSNLYPEKYFLRNSSYIMEYVFKALVYIAKFKYFAIENVIDYINNHLPTFINMYIIYDNKRMTFLDALHYNKIDNILIKNIKEQYNAKFSYELIETITIDDFNLESIKYACKLNYITTNQLINSKKLLDLQNDENKQRCNIINEMNNDYNYNDETFLKNFMMAKNKEFFRIYDAKENDFHDNIEMIYDKYKTQKDSILMCELDVSKYAMLEQSTRQKIAYKEYLKRTPIEMTHEYLKSINCVKQTYNFDDPILQPLIIEKIVEILKTTDCFGNLQNSFTKLKQHDLQSNDDFESFEFSGESFENLNTISNDSNKSPNST